jgi:oxalate decarboxylase/phosphoglucose isomerase-like protein (cupin superfamily)
MKSLRFAVLTGVLTAALPLAAAAQDPVKVDAGHYKVAVDNASVRVLRINMPVGEKSPMHAHPDAILIPLASTKARFTLPDGKTQDSDVVKETAIYTPAGTHSPANVGSTGVDAVLVEFKKPAGSATLPSSRPGIQSTVLAETAQAVAFRATSGPDFHEAAGTTHEYDQVVVALGAADMTLAVEGKPAVTKWQRGDAHFIPRGAKHESRNTSGKPVEFIIVAIR